MNTKLKNLREDLLFELQDDEIIVQGEDDYDDDMDIDVNFDDDDGDFIDTETDVDDIEKDEDDKDRGDSFVRMETTTKIRGVIRRVNYEVNFQDLSKEINDEIAGVTLTRAKARQLFHIFKNSIGF